MSLMLCHYCQAEAPCELDAVKPLSRAAVGPIVPACALCRCAKGGRDLAAWLGEELLRAPLTYPTGIHSDISWLRPRVLKFIRCGWLTSEWLHAIGSELLAEAGRRDQLVSEAVLQIGMWEAELGLET